MIGLCAWHEIEKTCGISHVFVTFMENIPHPNHNLLLNFIVVAFD